MSKALFIVLTILVLALPVGAWWIFVLPLPALEGRIYNAELQEPVLVRFDGRAVPYIQAGSDDDLYLALGYLTARDRMFQMDMLRRTALGTLSQVFGPATLASDRLARTLGFRLSAAREESHLAPEVKRCLAAYCRGVDYYLRSHDNRLPLEFRLLGLKPERWQIIDSLAIMKYLAYTQDQSWQLDELRQRILDKVGEPVFRRLFAEDWPLTPPFALLKSAPCHGQLLANLAHLGASSFSLAGQAASLGSSAWAVEARLSKSGGSLLACDKHDHFLSPDLWYLVSLQSPALHVAGATIPGVPAVLVGRNDKIAWGTASLKADVQDLFLEEFSSRFPNQYRTAAGWQQAEEVREAIPLRWAKDLVLSVVTTAHGPVLTKTGNTAVALAWTGLQGERSALACYFKLNRAEGWPQFLSALAEYPGPAQNFVYADSSGKVGFHAAGDIPVRRSNGQGTTIVRSGQTSGQWTATIGFDELPSAFSPGRGFVVAANQKVALSASRHLIGHQWAGPYRAFRVATVLGNLKGRGAGLPDMNDLQADQKAALAELVRQEIHQAVVTTELIDRLQLTALALIERWDGALHSDSAASAIYQAFIHTLAKRLLEPKLGIELTREYMRGWALWPLLLENYLREKPADWLPPRERNNTTFVLTTFSQALKDLRLSFGNEDAQSWSWGRQHRAIFRHLITRGIPWLGPLFDSGPVALGGDQDTVNACNAISTPEPGRFAAESGPCVRMLVDLSDRDKFYQSLSLGQSGQLLSPFQQDQLKHWLHADPMPIAWSQAQLDKQAQHRLVLTNASGPTPGRPR